MTTAEGSDRRCGRDAGDGRERLAREAHALTLLALDHLDPLLARLRDAVVRALSNSLVDNSLADNDLTDEPRPDHAQPPTSPCTACPVCTALAVVRREHPELAERLSVHAAGLLAALRDALDGRPDPDSPAPAPPPPRVQHIPVERTPGPAASTGAEPC